MSSTTEDLQGRFPQDLYRAHRFSSPGRQMSSVSGVFQRTLSKGVWTGNGRITDPFLKPLQK